jgi:transcriptional regulator with XRE-family HTH domain
MESISFYSTHTLRLFMAKRATVKTPPLDFGGESLGERLARLRKQRGYTQIDLAEKVGTTQVLLSAYETGRCQFSVEMAIRFALALDISTDELLHPKTKKRRAERKPSLKVMRRMEEIEKLPPREQSAVLSALDTMLRGATR